MTSKDFMEAFSFTRKWEGGYVNDPDDPGGATKCGVIQSTYDAYRRSKKLPAQDVRYITQEEIEDVFYELYWRAGHCDQLPYPLNVVMFDTFIQYGVKGGIKVLQRTLHVNQDGVLGPITLEAMSKPDSHKLAIAVCDTRRIKRRERVQEKPSQQKFLRGWLNRDVDLIRHVTACKRREPLVD